MINASENNVPEFNADNRHAGNCPVGQQFCAHPYRRTFPLVIVGALGETLSLGKDRVEMADKSKKTPKKMPKQMPRQQQQQRQEQMGEDSRGMTRAGQDDRREPRRPGQH
ncbi:hypothetical protein [Nocardia asteroides]|uniref:Uncharacterized protein n=2 Tax=Nocardia asteroides TaxID=1824 RepID=U5E9N2_NOCAS|nr:hypothetical protein [Nocardia asteroides NBRC 15531]GAD86812.1 hypothetical protein NCAST_33_01910 [Nocardia asteroides NBRC 15531]